jgi:carbonic anhydrase
LSAKSDGLSEADQLSIVNVVTQMERLTRNPILAAANLDGPCV